VATCPDCGNTTRFVVGRTVHVWQTQTILLTGSISRYEVEQEDMFDVQDADPYTRAWCAECERELGVDDLQL
jgi:RNase P subunit RPR2